MAEIPKTRPYVPDLEAETLQFFASCRADDRPHRSRLGFVRIGEVIAVKPDGATRPSLSWELERDAWDALRSVRRTG